MSATHRGRRSSYGVNLFSKSHFSELVERRSIGRSKSYGMGKVVSQLHWRTVNGLAYIFPRR